MNFNFEKHLIKSDKTIDNKLPLNHRLLISLWFEHRDKEYTGACARIPAHK